ncbi:MAG: hypothetical protein QOH18_1617, partial [Solirubrobacterales bacterium]|nr:hypothetical protein [Solirubrobacterales bacterium]
CDTKSHEFEWIYRLEVQLLLMV